MCKKILVIIGMVLFVSFKITNLHADSLQIIPPQKPTLSSEEKIKKISKNIITPLKKPSKLKKVEKKIVTKEFKEKKLSFKVPKKKPTVAGVTTRKNIKISKYYSKKDFGLAKKAMKKRPKSVTLLNRNSRTPQSRRNCHYPARRTYLFASILAQSVCLSPASIYYSS